MPVIHVALIEAIATLRNEAESENSKAMNKVYDLIGNGTASEPVASYLRQTIATGGDITRVGELKAKLADIEDHADRAHILQHVDKAIAIFQARR
ncbi:uncharacterized protein AMSG_08956 [Thecamonas trahens ATCC 50062]|uniref:Uncharacterized protein n=1 Tax=Thecamonas trahens ATCC 50062 TaxID=461836 RepID=A0A0L0DL98_THETB|nr:hypothetical protein AMSG_08956 [Thecamonas trahens ATCC 50062]KNC52816.1 hypothetical protein AMSG_08956 [Thecamonas trahens ATCC 50062]|eukprot:XP_013754922.1 hypothetical protein AMSG_08956 [Thecamonas trahens ATCC 50062]